MQISALTYEKIIEQKIAELAIDKAPGQLYEPLRYILSIGGKRLRPQLIFIANALFEENIEDCAYAALAVELFHNFTLIHDDIMDNAPLRRGNPTVHEKWNINTGILSGDAMLVVAFAQINKIKSARIREIYDVFNTTAIEVCEGQQFDMNYENQEAVSINDYLEMIRLKTAVLLAGSLKIGAVLGDASEDNCKKIYLFGENLGMGFQLMDDYLDVYGDPEKFGKQIGGDIISNKKTYLMLSALDKANDADKVELQQWISAKNPDNKAKVAAVTEIYSRNGIDQLSWKKMNEYYNKAYSLLEEIQVPEHKKSQLKAFADLLSKRIQ
ncbi:MAG: polyprenyl synthetase family protein [Bacteroidetes bacterium]|nr:polyprenyl synthetase family protein [Bacteroidota bacterium]